MRLSVLSTGGGIALALLTLSTAAPKATAGAIYDNLAQTSGGNDPLAGFGPLADSFSTGITAVTLTDVHLLIDASNPADGGTFAIDLLADAATTPDFAGSLGVISGIADSSLTGSFADYDYVFGTPVALAANTRYWLALDMASGTSLNWSWVDTNGGTGTDSEYFSNSTGVSQDSYGPYQMQVNVSSATPEPASWSLMVVFGVCASAFTACRPEEVSVD